MVDIQPATAENTRGKKRKNKEETTAGKYNRLPYLGGHKNRDAQTNDPAKKSVESVLKPEYSLWWERFVKEVGFGAEVKQKGTEL